MNIQYKLSVFVGLVLCGVIFFQINTACAYLLETPDPEPFRGNDEIEGRSFDYGPEGFLHRFTYRYRPELAQKSRNHTDGFAATAGSTKTNELYVRMKAEKTVKFDVPVYFTYRFKRDEDFDSRYDRNIAGFGVELPGNLSLAAFGDIQSTKAKIDTHFELTKKDNAGNYIRTAILYIDPAFNSKQDDGKYEKPPLTYFAQAYMQDENDFKLHGFINYNAPLRLSILSREFNFWYEQITTGLDLSKRISDENYLFASFKTEQGTRDRWSTAVVKDDERHFSRRYFEYTLQLNRIFKEDLNGWIGLRCLSFIERDRRPLNLTQEHNERRREKMLYGGLTWQFHEKALFWPGVYLNFTENNLDFPYSAGQDNIDKGIFSKLALPVEITLSDTATITFNSTIHLDRTVFGGMNIQTNMRF